MIPTTESEAIAELKKIGDNLGTLSQGMLEVEQDFRYSLKDRETASFVRQYCEINANAVTDVIAGLSKLFAVKNPSSMLSIIDALTRK